MLPSDVVNVQTGISDQTAFFIVGGAILVVYAGIWAFKRIMFLFAVPDHDTEDYQNYSERKRNGG